MHVKAAVTVYKLCLPPYRSSDSIFLCNELPAATYTHFIAIYLINATTLKLERFDEEARTPPDAILSHTWGDTEVTFEAVTGIDEIILLDPEPVRLEDVSIARRMSWAARRTTTRTEVLAYCLLGIFDIKMALLYGEGDKAFVRLQEEIMKESNDQSLFAWSAPYEPEGDLYQALSLRRSKSVFADHARDFKESSLIRPRYRAVLFALTNSGVKINTMILPFDSPDSWASANLSPVQQAIERSGTILAVLDCYYTFCQSDASTRESSPALSDNEGGLRPSFLGSGVHHEENADCRREGSLDAIVAVYAKTFSSKEQVKGLQAFFSSFDDREESLYQLHRRLCN
ncbi:heterokaryon incompatibility protein [Stagonosporopsis vannaccii]|nr:heterokaryon incompatibility protein [Stagonosporopsis vannaccii]